MNGIRYEYLSNFELNSFKVLSVGFSDDIAITNAKCSRNQFIIHYCTDGIGYFNGKKIKKGQGFIIPPNFFADYYADKDNPWTFFWIILTPSAYEGTKKIYLYNNDYIFDYNFSNYIKALGEEILENSHTGYSEIDAINVYYLILNKQIENYQEIKQLYNYHKKEDSSYYARFAKRYIDVYYYKPIKINDICKILNISHTYLYKEFEKRYNKSLKSYLTEIKINNSIKLLLNTDLNITQVAQSIGFDDILAFSSFFKKNTGYSPLKYKKLYK